MTIDEDDTHYIIRTTVPYLDMMSADFRIEQRNLFIRGQVNNPDGSSYQGMYVRHLDLSEEIDPNHLEARFDLRGRVTLYLHKVDIVDSVDGQKVVDCPELP
jgi:HSP20 family molecular chaperone IbpA